MKSLPSFGNDHTASVGNVGRLLADVMASVDEALGKEARAYGISAPQWVVLMRIHNGTASTAAALCRALRYDSGSMTRMLDRLSAAGLIERHPDGTDRRVTQLALTPKGSDLLAKVEPIGFTVMQRFLSGFSSQEVGLLTGLLQRMLAPAAPK